MPATKARSEAAILVAVVFLLGVLLGGVGNHLWGERVWGMRADVPSSQQKHLDAQLTQELDLSPDQQKQLHIVVEETQAKWRALYGPLEGQRAQIRKESRDDMRAILTADQQVKFDAFMKRLDEGRKANEAKNAIPGPARKQ
jgi:Spy/CpxP family protein refolding chaperone